MDTIFVIFAVAFVVSLVPLGWLVLRAYRNFRGTRVVTCPETRRPVAVELDAGHAAVTGVTGEADLRLQACSRWPERQDCGQECLAQIEAAPEECLVRTMLTNWYKDERCALCGREFGPIQWSEHKPVLMSPERVRMEWDTVAPETLPQVLQTHYRVCWNCHMAESFRALHPDLVLDDPLRSEPRRSRSA